MKKPLVSIVVRTHNRADQLKIALKSIIYQTYDPIEVLVVDHNSDDHTKAVVDTFKDEVKYFLHTGSFRDTFHVWRDKISGDYVSVLDDDDFIHPECIEKLVNFITNNKEIQIVFGRHKYFVVKGGELFFENTSPKLDCRKIHKQLLVKGVVQWNAILFQKSCIQKIEHIDKSIVGAFDYYIWIQMALEGYRYYQLNEILGYIQRNEESVQDDGDRIATGRSQCVKYYGDRLPFFKKLIWGYFTGYGYNLICQGIAWMENNKIEKGRKMLLEGIFKYSFGFRARMKIIPAVLILVASLLSNPAKARIRIEKLFQNYLFRIYQQRKGALYKKENYIKILNR